MREDQGITSSLYNLFVLYLAGNLLLGAHNFIVSVFVCAFVCVCARGGGVKLRLIEDQLMPVEDCRLQP